MGGHSTLSSDCNADDGADPLVARISAVPGIIDCAVYEVSSGAGALRVLAVVGPAAASLATDPPSGILRSEGGADVILPVTALDENIHQDAPLWSAAAKEAATRRVAAQFDTSDVAMTFAWDVAPVARAPFGAGNGQAAPVAPTDRTGFGRKLSNQPALIEGAPYTPPDGYPVTLAEAVMRLQGSTQEIVVYRPNGQVDRLPHDTVLDQALRVKAGLAAQGLKKGDIVLCDVTDAMQSTAIIWGATLAGIVPALITVPAKDDANTDAIARLKAAAQVLGHPPIVLDGARALADLGTLRQLDAHSLITHDGAVPEPAQIDPEDDAVIFLTSGSTGVPKGVVQSHRAVLSMIGAALQQGAGVTDGHPMFNWMPRDHVGSYMFGAAGACVLGVSQVHADTGWILADPTRWLDIISDNRAGLTWSPNFSFSLITQAAQRHPKDWDLSSLHAIFNGGETVTEDVLDTFIASMTPFGMTGAGVMIPSLGMSETCSAVTLGRLGRARGPFTSLGGAVPGTRIRAVDEAGTCLCEGEIGRIEVTGPQLLSRYHGIDTSALSEDGWYDTGDLGFVAGQELYLTGRLKDTVNINGATYFVHEIETALAGIPGLNDAATVVTAIQRPGHDREELAVFFAPEHEEWRDDPVVLAQLATALRDRLGARLALYPDLLVPVRAGDLPRTSIGKVVRRTLQDQVCAGLFDDQIAQVALATEAPHVAPFAAHRRVWRKISTPHAQARQVSPVLVCCDPETDIDFLNVPYERIPLNGALPLPGVAGRTIVFVAPVMGESATSGYNGLQQLGNQIARLPAELRPNRVLVLTQNAVATHGVDDVAPDHALLVGLVRAFEVTIGDVHWALVDVHCDDRPAQRRAILAARETVCAFRDGAWRAPRWRPEQVETASLRNAVTATGPWLVTGGLGGIGRHICKELQAVGTDLILVGRTPDEALDAVKTKALKDLNAKGTTLYLAGEFGSADMAERIADAEVRLGHRIAGVLHLAALAPEDDQMDADGFLRVWELAQSSLATAFALAKQRPGLRLVTVGSIVGQIGGRMKAYGAINAALAEMSSSAAAAGLSHVRLDLSCWENRGMSEDRTSAALLHADGLLPLGDAAGVALVRHAMAAPSGHAISGMDVRHPRHGWLEDVRAARPVLRPRVWVAGDGPDGVVSLSDARGADCAAPLHLLPTLPKTVEGAIDHSQLSAGWRDGRDGEDDGVAQVAALAMAETLSLDHAPISADFFALGGTSLQAASLAQRLSELFFVDLGIAHVFQAPRPVQMAATLRNREAEPGLADAAAQEILNVLGASQDHEKPA